MAKRKRSETTDMLARTTRARTRLQTGASVAVSPTTYGTRTRPKKPVVYVTTPTTATSSPLSSPPFSPITPSPKSPNVCEQDEREAFPDGSTVAGQSPAKSPIFQTPTHRGSYLDTWLPPHPSTSQYPIPSPQPGFRPTYIKPNPGAPLIAPGAVRQLQQPQQQADRRVGSYSIQNAQQHPAPVTHRGYPSHSSQAYAFTGWNKMLPDTLGPIQRPSASSSTPMRHPSPQQQQQNAGPPSRRPVPLVYDPPPQFRPRHDPAKPSHLRHAQTATSSLTNQRAFASYQPPNATRYQQEDWTARKRQALSAYCTPPYQHYPSKSGGTHPFTNQCMQGYLPPHSIPNHPVFLYHGRDLSDSRSPLPHVPGGPPLFKRNTVGDLTDFGYGPGVQVADEFRAAAAREENNSVMHHLWNGGQMDLLPGYGGW